MSCLTYAVTLTFFLSTPGVAEPTAGGFPAISAGTGQFLLKDLVLLAASACLHLRPYGQTRDGKQVIGDAPDLRFCRTIPASAHNDRQTLSL